jgi:Fic-DOC domain mobile mystery protein B
MPAAMSGDGNTPISPEELADLIPSLATKEELNEWERQNILRAREWATRHRRGSPAGVVSDEYVRKLHLKMFDETWKWAGQYRQTDKNIGVPFDEIPERLGVLFGDVRYWIKNETHSPDEMAVRFHHRLVSIHPFPNGNGRHARLLADVLVRMCGRPAFTWGSTDLVDRSQSRARYLDAVRAADRGDMKLLLEFARS